MDFACVGPRGVIGGTEKASGAGGTPSRSKLIDPALTSSWSVGRFAASAQRAFRRGRLEPVEREERQFSASDGQRLSICSLLPLTHDRTRLHGSGPAEGVKQPSQPRLERAGTKPVSCLLLALRLSFLELHRRKRAILVKKKPPLSSPAQDAVSVVQESPSGGDSIPFEASMPIK